MEGSIFIVKEDGILIELNEEQYDSELILQDLLAHYPKLLAGDQIDSDDPRKWLLVSKELPIPDDYCVGGRYSLDHLFLDQDAIPTLVEVKRCSDLRIRREVVAQMLDYAANAVLYLSVERIKMLFADRCNSMVLNSDTVLTEFLEGKNPEEYWQQAKTNLQAGRIRLLFVADKIPKELARIVEFLNNQMNPAEVLAIEIPRYAGGGIVSLAPRVIGQTTEAQDKKSSGVRETRQWDEISFFEALKEKHNNEIVLVARKLMDWANSNLTRRWWGKGKNHGSYFPVLDYKGLNYCPFALWTDGTIEIQFQYLKDRPPFESIEKRQELLAKLNAIGNVNLPEDSVIRRPSINMSRLTYPEAFSAFNSAMDWVVSEINNS